MTIIGYIALLGVSTELMIILLTVLFWFRYLERRRISDYLLTFIFCTLSVYFRDTGFVVIGVLAAMIAGVAKVSAEWKTQIRYWSLRYIPFVIVAASFLVMRYILTGPINPDNAVYSPGFSGSVALKRAIDLSATVGNFSLTYPGVMGARGLTGILAGDSKFVEFVLVAAVWLIIAFTVWQARSSWRLLIIPVIWIGLYLSPYFLIRNHQVYYFHEPLVGLALMVGICLDRAGRPLRMTWLVVVTTIAVNGFISNRHSYYYWQATADRAEVVKPIVESLKSNPPKSIVFITSHEQLDFWTFTISGPMVPHLLGSPDTKVFVVDSTTQITPEAKVYYLP